VTSVYELDLDATKDECSSTPADFVEYISSTLTSVKEQELDINVATDDSISEHVNSSEFANNAPADVEEQVSTVAEDTGPVMPDECATNTSVSGVSRQSEEDGGLNMPKDDCSREPVEPAVSANNAEVGSTVAEGTESVLLDERESYTPALVEEDLNMPKGDCSSESVVATLCENIAAAAAEALVSTVAEDSEPVLSDKCVSGIQAPAEELGLNMHRDDRSSEPLVPAECVNNEDAAAAVENVDSHLTEDGSVGELLMSARHISETAACVEDTDSVLTEVATSSSEPVVAVTETERDTETRDVLPVPTTALSSSPVDVMVCSADFFHTGIAQMKLICRPTSLKCLNQFARFLAHFNAISS